MAKPFCPGYGTVFSVTLQSAAQQLRFAGQTSWVRLKASAGASVYFTQDDATAGRNALTLNAEIFEGPLQASAIWISGSGQLDVLGLIPG